MTRSVRTLITLASLALPMVATRPVSGQAPAQPQTRLVIAITVDQFQVPYIDRYAAEFTGGLKRLLDGGAFFTNAFQDHAITETAPGHATPLAGRFPASHGIINNDFDVTDAAFPLIGAKGTGSSPFRFRGGTLIDWMRIQYTGSRALGISRKPRAAILPLGRSHQPSYWFVHGNFTTSTWFADTLPTWVRLFNERKLPASLAGQSWDLLMPASAYAEKDSVPIEHAGRDFMFPHRMPADSTILDDVIEYPVMDELLVAFAIEGLRALKLGAGRQPDLISLSLSTTDAVGHRFGPDSREIHDQVLRVDRVLGRFIDSVYAQVDSARVVFTLIADHGITPFPELHRTDSAQVKNDHVSARPALTAARAVLRSAGADTTAISFTDGMLLVNRTRLAAGFSVTPALDEFVRVARTIPGVASIMRRADLGRADTVRDVGARRWLHTLPLDSPAEILLTVRPGAVWGTSVEATHGSTKDSDAHVPLIFYGPPFVPGRYPEFVRSVDLAATLARILGVVPYERIDGRVLERALRK
jgi:predicted AlkP superfamily pyrophosphatase or phosphodiesterase